MLGVAFAGIAIVVAMSAAARSSSPTESSVSPTTTVASGIAVATTTPTVSTGTERESAAETTSTTTYKPPNGEKGTLLLTLTTDVPGSHPVLLRWGNWTRRFDVTGGAAITYFFEKKDLVGPDITLASTIPVRSSMKLGSPDGAIDARGVGWVKDP